MFQGLASQLGIYVFSRHLLASVAHCTLRYVSAFPTWIHSSFVRAETDDKPGLSRPGFVASSYASVCQVACSDKSPFSVRLCLCVCVFSDVVLVCCCLSSRVCPGGL